MRLMTLFALGLLSLLLSACSGVEIEPDSPAAFAAKHYTFYRWRTDPLPENTRSSDPVYLLDPALRKRVDSILADKGYVLDPARAQFSVDYLYATGLRDGASPGQASNISHIPSATVNRQVDQASVDNAIALGGVKETSNILLQFNDIESQTVVWEVFMTKIVENANRVDSGALEGNLRKYLERATRDLPPAGS
jgi:hypothetical protein